MFMSTTGVLVGVPLGYWRGTTSTPPGSQISWQRTLLGTARGTRAQGLRTRVTPPVAGKPHSVHAVLIPNTRIKDFLNGKVSISAHSFTLRHSLLTHTHRATPTHLPQPHLAPQTHGAKNSPSCAKNSTHLASTRSLAPTTRIKG